MSTFVLVHGAWHGSWCWRRVRRLLQLAGHEVFTPTLTGLAERSHLLTRDVNLSTHVGDVLSLIRWEELADVLLCGHSYGGAVASGVADRIPDHIRALVYLDAFVLESGENVLENVHESQRNLLIETTLKLGEGWKSPHVPAAVFNVNAADRDWVDRQCTPHPFACFEERLSLQGGLETLRSVTYIRASGWEDTPFPRAHARARARGWRTASMACGHDVMLDAPEELTRALIEAAQAS
ncbi:MAG TPA: alpha/beta fold hydrolase [Steroidobacteraceae bacterium]|nr:alpha/beta fold hydrolase [Steroidobacteraceae bacterium]